MQSNPTTTSEQKYIISVHGKQYAEYWTIRMPFTNAYMNVDGKWDYTPEASWYAARFTSKDAASAFAQYHTQGD